jgi:hypothetical protein
MDKRWYPVAFSVAIVGCSGDVDSGSPSATGGRFVAYYGPALSTGGSTGIDSGVPAQTGGVTPVPPYGIIPVHLGGSAGIGGTNPGSGNATAFTGGTTSRHTSIDGGAPSATGGRVPVVYGVIGIVGPNAWLRHFPF